MLSYVLLAGRLGRVVINTDHSCVPHRIAGLFFYNFQSKKLLCRINKTSAGSVDFHLA
jgi:hypothetical protein